MQERLAAVGRFLLKFLEASSYALQWAMYGPVIALFVCIAITAPFFAIWYSILHPNAYSFYVIAVVIASFVWVFFLRRNESEESPVKRGRKVLSPSEAKQQSKSRLKR